VLEAMAAGCPVVTSDRYGTKELAEGAAVLVNPESEASIAAGMAQLLEDQALKIRLIEAGHERSRAFRWRRCAEETLAVLEQVANAHGAPGVRRLHPPALSARSSWPIPPK
jgi:glycosyltransferase involved in cell wall biosynthesis